jgi:pSer/pThr/pTyr-binding forkhead associated (FHA) protein
MPYIIRRKIDGTIIDQWELQEKPIIFGRGEQTDVRLPDERMSRQHFVVRARDNKYFVQDLKSTNGTYLNNDRITESELNPNDRIRAGQSVFIYVLELPQSVATIMGEVEKEGKGLHTYIGELSQQPGKK